MTETRIYSFSYAALQRGDSLFDDGVPLREALRESWSPTSTVTRYRREWHISPIVEQTSDTWVGELGYVTPGELSTLEWDEARRRFIRGSAPAGSISPFAIDVRDGTCCFQLRPGYIRPTSFTSALQEILNLRGLTRWYVLPLVKAEDFPTWRRRVSRVTRFQFKMERPNPNYVDRPIVEELIEGVHAEAVTLRAKALAGESIDTEASIFRQAMDHVQMNYGDARVSGEDEQGGQSEWHSINGGVAPAISKAEFIGDPEAPPGLLARMLGMGRRDAQPQFLDVDVP